MPIDILNDTAVIKAINEQTISSDTTTDGIIVDTETFRGDLEVLFSGKFTAGDITPLLEESASATFATSNVIADIAIKPFISSLGVKSETGQEAAAIIDGTPAFNRLGLKKDQLKRYVRLALVSDNSANVIVSGFWRQEALVKSSQGTVVDTLD